MHTDKRYIKIIKLVGVFLFRFAALRKRYHIITISPPPVRYAFACATFNIHFFREDTNNPTPNYGCSSPPEDDNCIWSDPSPWMR